jgi:hypothetical protein
MSEDLNFTKNEVKTEAEKQAELENEEKAKELNISKAIREKFNEIDSRLDEFDKEQIQKEIEQQGGEIEKKSGFSLLPIFIAIIAFGYLAFKFVKNKKQKEPIKIQNVKADGLSSAIRG